MKKKAPVLEVKKKKCKNPTTNYPPDSHSVFCRRCYLHNNGCINTKSKRKDPNCRI